MRVHSTQRWFQAAASVMVVALHPCPHAQTTLASDRFEVASVKPTVTPLGIMGVRPEQGGRFIATNLSLRDLIRTAYKVRDSQIIGGPSWLGSARFDIVAKADRELPPYNPGGDIGLIERMLQALLADRFALVVRHETRDLPIYRLVMARGDRRMGERLRPSATDCAALFADGARTGQQGPIGPAGRPTCGMVISPWSIAIGGSPISQLAMVLAQRTNRVVVDDTGLIGNYDVDLQWTPPGVKPNPLSAGAPVPPVPAPPLNPGGASLETAIQEQLGLKLEADRGPVPIVLVERAERPGPD